MIHKQIEKLIPYISENFITYPLWEEGVYVPQVNIWKIHRTFDEQKEFIKTVKTTFKNSGYEFDYESNISISRIETKLHVFPKLKYLKSGGYKHINQNWSLEEMVEMLNKIIN